MENGTIGTPVTRCDRCGRLDAVASFGGHTHALGEALCGVHDDCPWCTLACRDTELANTLLLLQSEQQEHERTRAALAAANAKIASYDAELAAAEVTATMPPDEFFGSLGVPVPTR